ncbi:MAG TPA: FecR family protein, partial [Candidatus Kryptobacter bacterium]|nr:FecR family protein [Candidatus Kryptobacter bacterium]
MTNHRLKLLARYLASECTEAERLGVERWINSSSKNRRTFETLKAIWGLSGDKAEQWRSVRSITSFRLRLKTAEFDSRNNRGGTVRLYKIIPRQSTAGAYSISRALSIAAVILLVAGTAYLATFLKQVALDRQTSEKKPAVSYRQISTNPGQRIALTFADGTRILLNSASSLRYADVPDGKREFFLSGEAFFEVVHSDRRPMIVKTEDAVIKDIGTKFDVESWPGTRRT